MIYYKRLMNHLKHNPKNRYTGCVTYETGILVSFFKILYGIFLFLFVFFFLPITHITAYAKDPVVIVIDPGHGGENLGGEYDTYTEKDMNIIVANAMKERLEQYQNVIVYLTHDEDIDMSLKERALFAKSKNADFLFSLHFNLSVHHNLFGTEVWVSAFDKYYSQGYSFASIEMDSLTDLGLYSRGIKTKLNDEGTDYYGIIRQSRKVNIPAVIIEHCHLDQANDKPFYIEGIDQWKQFGYLDADSVARFYRLSSESLSIDNSNFAVPEINIPLDPVMPDLTVPEISQLTVEHIDYETGIATLTLKASDSNSYILYYNYSLDGGNTYSSLNAWPQNADSITFDVQLPDSKAVDLRANAYNGFDVFAESNIISVDSISYLEKESKEEQSYETIDLAREDIVTNDNSNKQFHFYLVLASFIFIFLILCISLFLFLCFSHKSKEITTRKKNCNKNNHSN